MITIGGGLMQQPKRNLNEPSIQQMPDGSFRAEIASQSGPKLTYMQREAVPFRPKVLGPGQSYFGALNANRRAAQQQAEQQAAQQAEAARLAAMTGNERAAMQRRQQMQAKAAMTQETMRSRPRASGAMMAARQQALPEQQQAAGQRVANYMESTLNEMQRRAQRRQDAALTRAKLMQRTGAANAPQLPPGLLSYGSQT